MEIVVLALFLLGGDQKRVDTEDVAVKANEIGPGRFTWRKYLDQISLEHVRVFLSDAKKEKNGAHVAGSGNKGWSLTSDGVAWAGKEIAHLEGSAEERHRLDKLSERRRRQELGRIRELPAWEKYCASEAVSEREAHAVFRVSGYSSLERRQELVERIRGLFVDDPDFAEFLGSMGEIVVSREKP